MYFDTDINIYKKITYFLNIKIVKIVLLLRVCLIYFIEKV